MNYQVKKIVPSPLFNMPGASFTRQHEYVTIGKCRFLQLYAEKGNLFKTGMPLHQSSFSTNALEGSINTQKRADSKQRRRKTAPSRKSLHPKISKSSKFNKSKTRSTKRRFQEFYRIHATSTSLFSVLFRLLNRV